MSTFQQDLQSRLLSNISENTATSLTDLRRTKSNITRKYSILNNYDHAKPPFDPFSFFFFSLFFSPDDNISYAYLLYHTLFLFCFGWSWWRRMTSSMMDSISRKRRERVIFAVYRFPSRFYHPKENKPRSVSGFMGGSPPIPTWSKKKHLYLF